MKTPNSFLFSPRKKKKKEKEKNLSNKSRKLWSLFISMHSVDVQASFSGIHVPTIALHPAHLSPLYGDKKLTTL